MQHTTENTKRSHCSYVYLESSREWKKSLKDQNIVRGTGEIQFGRFLYHCGVPPCPHPIPAQESARRGCNRRLFRTNNLHGDLLQGVR